MLVFLEVLDYDIRQLAVDMRPSINDLVVTFVICDYPHTIVSHHTLNLFITLLDKSSLFFWDDNVAKVERKTALEGHVVTEVLDIVKELSRNSYTTNLDNLTDDITKRLLTKCFINISYCFRNELINHETTNRSSNHATYLLAVFNIINIDIDSSMH